MLTKPTTVALEWRGVAAIIVKLLVCVGLCYLVLPQSGIWPFLAGVTLFLILTALTVLTCPGVIDRAGRYVMRGKIDKALEYYQHVYDFYSRHEKLDTYRHYLLMNASKLSFRETALLGEGFCYTCTGDFDAAMEKYRLVLEHYPDNKVARDNVRMLERLSEYAQKAESAEIDG